MSATFTRAGFEATLDEVGELLGDLWAVDEALKRVHGGDPQSVRVLVDVGRRHSFKVAILTSAPTQEGLEVPPLVVERDKAQRVMDDLAHQGYAWGVSVAAAFRQQVQQLVRPVPGAFEEAVDLLRADLIGPLSTQVADNFAHLSSLDDWEGGAAATFTDYTYTQLEHCLRNQSYAAESICFGLAGSKAIVNLGQHSLMGLVIAARDALDEQLRQREVSYGSTGPSGPDHYLSPRRPELMVDGHVTPGQWHHESAPR